MRVLGIGQVRTQDQDRRANHDLPKRFHTHFPILLIQVFTRPSKNLRRSAFTGANVEPLLTVAAKDFINHPRGVDLRDGKLYVSSLYDWYAEDFGGGDAAIIEHLRGFARPRLAAALKEIDEISGDAYDWSLNDAA